jgi:heat shock protein HslJ
MKKALALFVLSILISGCASNSNNNNSGLQKELIHRNYVLINYDGQTIEPKNMSPRIEFGETFFVSGAMCNSFAGQGSLRGDVLKVSNMAATQAMCMDDVRNQLDGVISEMLTKGVKIKLEDKILTLTNKKHTLIFTNRDWVY